DVERGAVSHAQLRDPLRLGEEAPRLAVPDYEIRRREEEDAVAVAPELRGDLLRPLEAEVPVDDREDDDVVPRRGPLRQRPAVGLRRRRRGRWSLLSRMRR